MKTFVHIVLKNYINHITIFMAVICGISTMTIEYYSLVLLCLKIFIPCIIGQHNIGMTFPNAENQSATLMNTITSISTIPNTIPSVIASPIVSNTPSSIPKNIGKNYWPPSEPEFTQALPYTSDIQPMPVTYYLSAPPSPSVISQYRSEQWSPYGYPESGYPVIPPNVHHQIGITPKYISVAIFIGLLTLFAIIQGSLLVAKQKEGFLDAHSSRKKRDLLIETAFENMTPEQQDILTNDGKIQCIQRTICIENQQIIKDYGSGGKKLAKYLTRSVKKSLNNSSGWDRLVEDAGAAGLRGENCNLLYRDCVLPAIFQSHPPK